MPSPHWRWLAVASILAACSPLFALDNAVRITDAEGKDQPGRPFTIARWFAEDEICDWPQPFVNGEAVATWQSDRVNRWPASAKCPGGSAQYALVSLRADVPANGRLTVDFRNNAAACSAGGPSACRQAGLSSSDALGFMDGGWNAEMSFFAKPQGQTAPAVVDARTMLANGSCSAWLIGPVVTQYVCGPYDANGNFDPSRRYALGWRERFVTPVASLLGEGGTELPLLDTTPFRQLPRPFKVFLRGYDVEWASVCFVDEKSLYFGTTNGNSPACQSKAGRGQDGTKDQYHPAITQVYTASAMGVVTAVAANRYSETIQVSDAAPIGDGARLRINAEEIRICGKSGNTLFAGATGTGCAKGDTSGRSYRGTTADTHFFAKEPVYMAGDPTRWMDAPSERFRSLNPIFVVTLYADWPGVGVEFITENTWIDRLQDQEYDVVFKAGSPLQEVGSRGEVRHVARSRWRYPDGPEIGAFGQNGAVGRGDRKIWSGKSPGAVRYDFNLPYLRYSGLVPNNPNVALSNDAAKAELTQDFATQAGPSPGWDNGSKCSIESTETLTGKYRGFAGPVLRPIPAPGGRGDIGLNPRWYVAYLHGMASDDNAFRLQEMFWGTASCSGFDPVYFTESAKDRRYCDNGGSPANPEAKSCGPANRQTNAFGYPLSRDARPFVAPEYMQNSAPEDAFYPVGHVTGNGFTHVSEGAAHLAAYSWLPYALTGDWYWYWGVMHEASYAATGSTGSPGYDANAATAAAREQQSHGAWSAIGFMNGARTYAWAMRNTGRAAVAGRDGSPEKEYFTKKLDTNIAIGEGKYNIRNGSFYEPCPDPIGKQYDQTYWCFGHIYRGNGSDSMGVTYPPQVPGGYGPCGDAKTQYACDADWMQNFVIVSLGDLENQGIREIRPLRTAMQRRQLNMILNRSQFRNPYLVEAYVAPAYPCLPEGVSQDKGCQEYAWKQIGTQTAFTNWATLYESFSADLKARNKFTNDGDLEGGYSRIAHAAASFLPDGVAEGAMQGMAAWEWIDGALGNRQLDSSNQMWVFSPKFRHRINVGEPKAVGSSVEFRFAPPPGAAACSYRLAAGDAMSSLDNEDTPVQPRSPETVVTVDQLQPGDYTLRVTCGMARGERVFTVTPSGTLQNREQILANRRREQGLDTGGQRRRQTVASAGLLGALLLAGVGVERRLRRR